MRCPRMLTATVLQCLTSRLVRSPVPVHMYGEAKRMSGVKSYNGNFAKTAS